MTNSLRSSHASETCRLEWRPSRLLCAALVSLGLTGAFAVLASGMPAAVGWLLAPAALAGGWRVAAREAARPARTVMWDGHAGVVRVDGIAVTAPTLTWRGALACLAWRDARGRRQRLLFWPDVLDALKRRELRLAAGPVAASPAKASMAP
jgi:toxin CptA